MPRPEHLAHTLRAYDKIISALCQLLTKLNCPAKDQKVFVAQHGYCLDCCDELDECGCDQSEEDEDTEDM